MNKNILLKMFGSIICISFVIAGVLTINPISITLYTSRNQTREESTRSKIETPQPSFVNKWLPTARLYVRVVMINTTLKFAAMRRGCD